MANPPEGIVIHRYGNGFSVSPVRRDGATWQRVFFNTMLMSISIYGNNQTARQADQLINHVQAQQDA